VLLHALFDPDPAPLWARSFLRALEDGFPVDTAFGVLSLEDLEDADGNVPHLSDVEASDEDLGAVQAVIRRWPRGLLLGFDPSCYRLPLPSYEIDAEDPEGALAAILTGATGRAAYNTRVRIRLGHLAVTSAMWPTVWRGILADWGSPEQNVLRLVCRHDSGWLEAPLAKHRVRAGDFPHAHLSARGAVLPVAVGTFDARATTGTGAVPCLYLDTRSTERLFAPQLGVAHAIPRVYLNGTLAEEATDYDLAAETIAGFDFRTIRWLSDPGADPEVWCDLTGLEDVGDGSGRPIQTLAHQLRHLLVNFGFSDWRSGAWTDPATAPLNLGTWEDVGHELAANRMRPRGRANNWTQGRRTALLVDTDARALDVLNRAALGAGFYPYWDEEGRLAVAMVSHRTARVFFEGSHWIRDEDVLGGEVSQVPAKQRLRDEFSTPPSLVADPTVSHDAAEEIPFPWADQPIHEADLVPYETTNESAAWTTTSPGDPHQEIDDPPYVPDDATTRATWDAASATGTFRVRARWADLPQMPAGHSIAAVSLHWRARYDPNGGGTHTMKAGVWIGGAAFYSAAGDRTLTTSWVDYEDLFLLNPDTAAAWDMADLGPDLLELIVSATHTASQDKPEITQLFARVYLVAEGAAGDLVRERLTRELLLGRRPPLITEAIVGLHRAAMAPGDPCSVSAVTVVAPEQSPVGTDGWGVETWQRHPHVMAARYLDLGEKRALLRMVDARDLVVPMWEVDRALAIAPQAQGVARMGAWRAGRAGQPGGRRFSRPTDSDGDPTGIDSMTGPNGDTVSIPADTERYSAAGNLLIAAQSGAGPAQAADKLRYSWHHDAQPWPIEGGSAILHIDAGSGSANAAMGLGSDLVIVENGTDIFFRRTVDGVDYQATIDLAGAGISGTLIVGLRWTPGEGGLTRLDADENEEDVPPYTLDLWVRQGSLTARAVSVVAVAGHACVPNGSANPALWMGADQDGSQALDGAFRFRRVWRSLLTDDEMAAEMEALA
jgi:hypothetical protein